MNRSFVNVMFAISLIAWILYMAIYWTYIRFTHIDMTETRLFVTYWNQVVLHLVIFLTLTVGYEMTS